MEEIKVKTEKVDDVPLILHIVSEMGIGPIIDEIIRPHGNKQGMSMGTTIMVWVSYILSQSDHRMSEVEEWAASQMIMLKTLIPDEIEAKHFADDKLADCLRLLSKEENWQEIEKRLTQRLISVYKLETEVIRLDSTSCAVYHDSEGKELIKYGYSKDHRPDLAQFKVMLATLDPMGMPAATLVVEGNGSDDGLYIPTIDKVQKIVGKAGHLYVGDSKMAAKKIRARIEKDKDYYLMPLPQTGTNPDLLEEIFEKVKSKQVKVDKLYKKEKGGILALAVEEVREQKIKVEGKEQTWQERVIALYSPKLGVELRRNLDERISKAKIELLDLTPSPKRGVRQAKELCPLQSQAQEIIKRYRVEAFLTLDYKEQTYNTSKHSSQVQLRYEISVSLNSSIIKKERELLGWRIYATNAPRSLLSLEKAVGIYRNSSSIDHNFSRLKGQPLGLRPLFIKREDHLIGLVRLLSLALRVLTLTEFLVRQALHDSNESLSGLYSGNPNRKSSTPTAERLLKAFRGIFLSIVFLPGKTVFHLSPLSPLQSQIISLLGLPVSIYHVLISEIPFSFP